jgi:hypothetical protein
LPPSIKEAGMCGRAIDRETIFVLLFGWAAALAVTLT